jgi:hypothetical protein
VYLNWLQFFDFFCEWIAAGGSRSILELLDQKAQVFLVQTGLSPHSLIHAHMVLSEMSVRT